MQGLVVAYCVVASALVQRAAAPAVSKLSGRVVFTGLLHCCASGLPYAARVSMLSVAGAFGCTSVGRCGV